MKKLHMNWIKLWKWKIKVNLRTYNNIQNSSIGQEDDYTTGFLLDSYNFNNYYILIAIDLSKKQPIDADSKTNQKITLQEI